MDNVGQTHGKNHTLASLPVHREWTRMDSFAGQVRRDEIECHCWGK